MMDTVLSLLVLATVALIGGAVFFWRRGERKRPALMLGMAFLIVADLAVWLTPVAGGPSLIEVAHQAPD
ncbi:MULTISPECIES: hypothetical protein [unclassified Novosphingobium]|nr:MULTISPECIES: hypothetical protein [unclassified Novosphingobium]MBB3479273.1 hypothetical protein [Novosphingobium sp. BK369]MBB3359640.1 hypothetical protein [Novosphingobium sp. BK256]MBB3375994.1 hypothetical protein [Novosphingobium sp. BK280]MBB3380413.1 hypothetical protein [Novosphingobium sp. BK258]MBB3422065.1 hypothetical protein [Novosphingobium sp. BK267]